VAQSFQGARNRLVAAPATLEPTVPVVRLGVAIQADPDHDTKLAEKPEIGVVQTDGISLHADLYADVRAGLLPRLGHQFPDELVPGQQRFTAVQNQADVRDPVGARVLADAAR